ncbi:MAG: hypothetical protein GOV02_00790 [Candidatus Aenigmarchaeota archaeon]|nr:hypothetical protein [Candidatus Aenigmarchaeota archaeon]
MTEKELLTLLILLGMRADNHTQYKHMDWVYRNEKISIAKKSPSNFGIKEKYNFMFAINGVRATHCTLEELFELINKEEK